MSKILNELTSGLIKLSECLERLLIISKKTNNSDLSAWCMNELNGYQGFNTLPSYRKYSSRNIIYSGLAGMLQITNTPIQAGYLSENTLKQVESIGIFENIYDVEKKKDEKQQMYRDLTVLASEIYKNTDGIQCTSIKQLINPEFYSRVYAAVKTRVINLICSFEDAGVDLDNLDIKKNGQSIKNLNKEIYDAIIVNGKTFTIPKKENKILWQIIVPIIVGIVSAVASGLIVYFLTKGL